MYRRISVGRFKVAFRHAILILLLRQSPRCVAWAWNENRAAAPHPRRHVLAVGGGILASTAITGRASPFASAPAAAADASLAARLAKRDAAVLRNRVLNLQPPAALVYPVWMRGDWTVASAFAGYTFPSAAISKERLVRNAAIAGFLKCSIAATADVGKERVTYPLTIDRNTGQADVKRDLPLQINAYLGYPAVDAIWCDPQKNPNRVSLDFVDYRTVNAERIELFCNARESQEYNSVRNDNNDNNNDPAAVFVCAEYLRQVTFGTGSTLGVPRQAVTNYAHFWTWRQPNEEASGGGGGENADDGTSRRLLRGNLLTAAYLDPLDAMFFEEPSLPVAVYSHTLTATRRRSAAGE